MKAILYGVGRRYHTLFSIDEEADVGLIKDEVEIVGFADGDRKKWGSPLFYEARKFIVKSIDDFPEDFFDKIIVTTAQQYGEILCGLMKKGYEKEQILLIDQIFEANSELIYYENSLFFSKQWKRACKSGCIKTLLQDKKYKRIAVYGLGKLTDDLLEALMESKNFTIEYFLSFDINKKEKEGLMVYRPDTKLPPSDLIIVATLEDYLEIERTICENNDIEVISIQELVYKVLKNTRGMHRYA